VCATVAAPATTGWASKPSSTSQVVSSSVARSSRRAATSPVASRGATLAVVELAQGRLARLRLRTGSYANWPALAHAAVGNLLPDFPLINKSFELCYACVDR